MAQQQQVPVMVMPAGEKKTSVGQIILWIILIIVILTLLFYVYFWSTSTIGSQKISGAWQSLKTTYNPLSWYGNQLKEAKDIGRIWETSENQTAESLGVKFLAFESVGGKIMPQGAMLVLRYKLDLGEGVKELPLDLECKLKDPSVKEKEIEVESKTLLPVDKPKVSTEDPQSYSSITCQIVTKTSTQDKTVTAEGTVKFPINNQRGSLKVYFTEDKVNKGKAFFQEQGLKETLPIMAKYNKEPVELGIGVGYENVQPVIVGEDQFPSVGISLKNRWDGRVKKIRSLALILPKGIQIDEEKNKNPTIVCPFESAGNVGTGKYQKYSAKESVLAQITEFGKTSTSLDLSRSFFCWLKPVPAEILGNNPFIDDEYSVEVSYDYELQPRTETITLKGVPLGETAQPTTPQSDKTPTTTTENQGTQTSSTTPTVTKYYLCENPARGEFSCVTQCNPTDCESSCEKTFFNTQGECDTQAIILNQAVYGT